MASTFRSVLKTGIGTSGATPVLTTGATAKTTVIGLSLTNLTAGNILASIRIDDGTVSAFYIKNVVVPANQSLRVINGGEKLILASSTNLYITSNTATSLDLVMSFVEIT
jgi:hypothetical protein